MKTEQQNPEKGLFQPVPYLLVETLRKHSELSRAHFHICFFFFPLNSILEPNSAYPKQLQPLLVSGELCLDIAELKHDGNLF